MNGFFSRVQDKLHEARISDVNHELGKVKENLYTESSAYISNFKTDAASVGALIRSESVKFSSLLGGVTSGWRSRPKDDECDEPVRGIPKSTSLPTFGDNKVAGSRKYQYKSSFARQDILEEDFDSERERVRGGGLDQSVVDRFIKVVEVKDPVPAPTTSRRVKPSRPNTREEIRKKLASFGASEDSGTRSNGFKRGFQPENSDLQICFINEAVTSDDEEDATTTTATDSCDVEHREDSEIDSDSEDENEDIDTVFPRSKSDWESFRNPEFLESPTTSPSKTHREERRAAKLKKKIAKLQKEVQLNLNDCSVIAQRLIAKEKLKRQENHPLKALLGIETAHFESQDELKNFNITALQVIVNHIHTRIEDLNKELVEVLIAKDELQIEQDSQLLDIEDLTHSLPH